MIMNKNKKKLILMLIIQAFLTISHKMLNDPNEVNFVTWHYLSALGFGVFIVIFALKLGCPHCGARQVFRGWSIFDIRWPENDCHGCKKSLD